MPKPDASGLQNMLRQVEVDFDQNNLTARWAAGVGRTRLLLGV